MRGSYSDKHKKVFFIILVGVLLLTAVSAGAAQYKLANIFSYNDAPDNGITVGSYYFNYKFKTLTASKIVNGVKTNAIVLDTSCGFDADCNILTNGKTVFYFKYGPKRMQLTLCRINANGKRKKELVTWKGYGARFRNKIGNDIYFTSLTLRNREGDSFNNFYVYNLKTGKMKALKTKFLGGIYSYFGSKYLTIIRFRDEESNRSIQISYYDYAKRKIVKTNVIKNINGWDFGIVYDTMVRKYHYIPMSFVEQDGDNFQNIYTLYRIPLNSTQKPVRVFEEPDQIYPELIQGNYLYYTKIYFTKGVNIFRFFRFNLTTKATEKLTKKSYLKLSGLPKENYN